MIQSDLCISRKVNYFRGVYTCALREHSFREQSFTSSTFFLMVFMVAESSITSFFLRLRVAECCEMKKWLCNIIFTVYCTYILQTECNTLSASETVIFMRACTLSISGKENRATTATRYRLALFTTLEYSSLLLLQTFVVEKNLVDFRASLSLEFLKCFFLWWRCGRSRWLTPNLGRGSLLVGC